MPPGTLNRILKQTERRIRKAVEVHIGGELSLAQRGASYGHVPAHSKRSMVRIECFILSDSFTVPHTLASPVRRPQLLLIAVGSLPRMDFDVLGAIGTRHMELVSKSLKSNESFSTVCETHGTPLKVLVVRKEHWL